VYPALRRLCIHRDPGIVSAAVRCLKPLLDDVPLFLVLSGTPTEPTTLAMYEAKAGPLIDSVLKAVNKILYTSLLSACHSHALLSLALSSYLHHISLLQ
jgi:hypothetical protein